LKQDLVLNLLIWVQHNSGISRSASFMRVT
jgi:hypothetical protein